MNTLKGLILLSLGVGLGAIFSSFRNKETPPDKRKKFYRDDTEYDEVDESSIESFPASDAPAWSKPPRNPDDYH